MYRLIAPHLAPAGFWDCNPKSWRIGLKAPGWRYPFDNPVHEQHFEAWLQRYDALTPRFAVCRLLAELGLHHRRWVKNACKTMVNGFQW